MSATPYSDAWRERTRERMAALGVSYSDISHPAGMTSVAVWDAVHGLAAVDLEDAGPIDELLDKLEEQAEAKALELPDICEVMHPGPHQLARRVKRVDVDLGPLCDCRVGFGEQQPKRTAAVAPSPPDPVGIGDERREWRQR